MIQLIRITDALPDGFDRLRAEADAEGYPNMSRLEAEFAQDPAVFTALLGAVQAGELVAVGGMTREPADAASLRMRRLYVARRARRQGVASVVVGALLQEALPQTRVVTVHAGDARGSRFWESLGFRGVDGRPWSHVYSAA